MKTRIITAIVAIIIFLPVCIFSDTWFYPTAMAILCTVGVYEMLSCVGMFKTPAVSVPSILLAVAMPMIPLFSDESTLILELGCIIGYLVLTFTADVFARGKLDYTVTSSAFRGVLYVSLSFTCMTLLREEGEYLYLLTFIGPWVSDSFAYFTGRFFGRHKLIPEVSPKKTVEGSIGGIVFAALSFVIYGIIIQKFFAPEIELNYVMLALSGAIVSVISQIGDLAASVIKRRFEVKDYGWIFPGHGGVIDRFDSVILTAPVLYILTQIPAFSSILI
ncbi:MAG: phosphatidate cytidylyltransferase [Clostridia bacterium]|nr:phosphatidate cytidylyltransferase [Clostridia bacterium]MBQ8369869.1 phosphatidate cytidylyltransferase [Clostridia bacterium]